MLAKEFDFVIYPLKLIITVGITYEDIVDRFDNKEEECAEWSDKKDFEYKSSFVNLVYDKSDGLYKILWWFNNTHEMTMRNICHESFHVSMSVCQYCNMSLGFKVGEDEHAAYIAGFAGNCAGLMFNELKDNENGNNEKENNDKEKEEPW